ADEVKELVDVVNCHPRALVLLAREVASGVRATAQSVGALMAKLERENEGDRENSLYASVALSLGRLPEGMRELVQGLAVFHGGGHMANMAHVMGIEANDVGAVAEGLIGVGMAEAQEYNYLRFDPALSTYLKVGQTAKRLAELESNWAEAMEHLVEFLYQQNFRNSRMAFRLTSLELPNVMALMSWLENDLENNKTRAKQKLSPSIAEAKPCLSSSLF
ncbi:MAG: hypothetical protein AAFP03_19275, partial [Cyanobacteria bacterium J06598_3]